jgi:hypothetical protein
VPDPDEQLPVSVIACFYNEEHYLPGFFRNVEASFLGHAQLVLVDDGSTDGTLDLLSAWAEGKPHVLVVPAPQNQGLAESRNLGLRSPRVCGAPGRRRPLAGSKLIRRSAPASCCSAVCGVRAPSTASRPLWSGWVAPEPPTPTPRALDGSRSTWRDASPSSVRPFAGWRPDAPEGEAEMPESRAPDPSPGVYLSPGRAQN